MINAKIAKKKLATVWFVGSGLIFAFFLFQMTSERYANIENDAWSWLLPNLIPTLGLMIATFVNERAIGEESAPADNFYYQLSLWVSIFYLGMLLWVMISFGWQPDDEDNPLKYYSKFSLFIVAVQGVTTAALGLFFTKK
jgi:cytochrome bd-type quinol oxidase subunit 2